MKTKSKKSIKKIAFFIAFEIFLFLLLVHFAQAVSLTEGVNGYWKLDGTGGTLAYDEINQTYDSLTGAFFIGGKINNGLSCGTTAQNYYMTILKANKNYDFIHRTGNFTISIWLYTYDTIQQQIVMANIYSSSGQYGFNFVINSDAKIQFVIVNGTAVKYPLELLSTTKIADQTWNNIVITGNKTNGYMYINGVFEKQAIINTLALTNNSATYDLYVGKVIGSTAYFGGKLDEVVIWNRYLNETEVQQLYNNGIGLQYPFIISEIEPEPEPITTDLSQYVVLFIIIIIVFFLMVFAEIINSNLIRYGGAIALFGLSFFLYSLSTIIALVVLCISILLLVRAFLWRK